LQHYSSSSFHFDVFSFLDIGFNTRQRLSMKAHFNGYFFVGNKKEIFSSGN
jgi:hypothetical protein